VLQIPWKALEEGNLPIGSKSLSEKGEQSKEVMSRHQAMFILHALINEAVDVWKLGKSINENPSSDQQKVCEGNRCGSDSQEYLIDVSLVSR
jgi:hypothetical protein